MKEIWYITYIVDDISTMTVIQLQLFFVLNCILFTDKPIFVLDLPKFVRKAIFEKLNMYALYF